jgi:hypothetical protein
MAGTVMLVSQVHRTEAELPEADRGRLEAAHRRLSAAVADYERRFVTPVVEQGVIESSSDADMAAAQAEVEGAEDALWQLREQLLGWTRPPWAPGATQTSEWFSDEDTIYDRSTPPDGG